MLDAILAGIVASLAVFLFQVSREWVAELSIFLPVLILGFGFFSAFYQKGRERIYYGFADLFAQIHVPTSTLKAGRWLAHAVSSFFLALAGLPVGVEGAAIEASHALMMARRSRSENWVDLRRRTDVAVALSSGVSAVFGAPLAGVLIPLELSTGGKTISSAVAALSAGIVGHLLSGFLPPSPLKLRPELALLSIGNYRLWIFALALTVACGLAGALLIRLIEQWRRAIATLTRSNAGFVIFISSVGLALWLWVLISAFGKGELIMELAIPETITAGQAGFWFCMSFIGVIWVLGGLGTTGVLLPVFWMGMMGSFSLLSLLTDLIPGATPGMLAVLSAVGGAALFGSVFGMPLVGSVIVLENTHSFTLLLICWLSASGARWIRSRLGTGTLFDYDLKWKGLSLQEGRSQSVLESISVSEAMVTDIQVIQEEEQVADIEARLEKTRYPFFPVLDQQNRYLGLLSIDTLKEAWVTSSEQPSSSNRPISRLLEAKDLLYRAGIKPPSVAPDAQLSALSGAFKHSPCIPVLTQERRVVGLVFSYNVRLAYDREVARRSLQVQFESGHKD